MKRMMDRWVMALGCVVALFSSPILSADWSRTEIQIQDGTYDQIYGGDSYDAVIITLQHLSGWKYGSNFFFVDQTFSDSGNDSYAELYSTLNASKIFDAEMNWLGIKDVGLVMGFNVAADSNVVKYLPGVNIEWRVPGFQYFGTMATAYFDDSDGTPVPREDDSWMLDLAWDSFFELWGQKFLFTGHVEYIAERDNEFGKEVSDWVLAQPQIRYDLGYLMYGQDDQLYVGIEYQYWNNKLGDKDTDERVTQLLVIWHL